jgi:hypothetical protein
MVLVGLQEERPDQLTCPSSSLQMAKLLPPKMNTLSNLPLLLGSLKGA